MSGPAPTPLLLLHPLPLTASPLQLELPWDTPTSDCAEYREWCYQNYFFSPWTKISNEPLGKWEEGREGREGEGRGEDVLRSAKHRSYTHACTCVLVYVLLCGCLLACTVVTSCKRRCSVMCVVCMLALLKKILRQAPSKRHTLESIKKHLWYRK